MSSSSAGLTSTSCSWILSLLVSKTVIRMDAERSTAEVAELKDVTTRQIARAGCRAGSTSARYSSLVYRVSLARLIIRMSKKYSLTQVHYVHS
jgi:hypothetical protein